MYGNAYIDPNEKANLILAEEDPQKLAEFEARIDRGEKIEPKDWMPKEYRKQLGSIRRRKVLKRSIFKRYA